MWGVLVTIVLFLPLIHRIRRIWSLLGVGFSVWSRASLSLHDRRWLPSVRRVVFSFAFCRIIKSLSIVWIPSVIFPSNLWCVVSLFIWLTIYWSIRIVIYIWIFFIKLSLCIVGGKYVRILIIWKRNHLLLIVSKWRGSLLSDIKSLLSILIWTHSVLLFSLKSL